MCQFGMTAPITGWKGEVGHVKKSTGFMSSSRFVAEELNRYCDGSHDHVHLVDGKAAAAQVYPPDLCRAMLRGTAKQKRADGLSLVSTGSMTSNRVQHFIESLSSVCLGPLRSVVDGLIEHGEVPGHWRDTVHEEDGGHDDRGIRPQHGIEILREELLSLIHI